MLSTGRNAKRKVKEPKPILSTKNKLQFSFILLTKWKQQNFPMWGQDWDWALNLGDQMVIDRKIPTLWRTAEMLSQKKIFPALDTSHSFCCISKMPPEIFNPLQQNTQWWTRIQGGRLSWRKTQMLFHFAADAWLGVLCRCVSNTVWSPELLTLCAIAAATFYFSPLWCLPPFCCFEFCCCHYKTCSFSNCLCLSGPRLPGRLMAGTPWHSLVGTEALQDKAKSGLTALQSLSITALEPLSTSQQLKGLFCLSTLDSCLDLC